MNAKMTRTVVRLAGIVAVAALVNVGVAAAARPTLPATKQAAKPKAAKPAVEKQVAIADGFHHATRLGGPRSLVGPVRDLKMLKRDMALPRVHKAVQGAIDAAGVSPAVRDEVMNTLVAADAASMKDTKFEVGGTMDWMGLKTNGKPDVIRNVRWNGVKPFPGWTFDVDDGEMLYHFIYPKACGNIALASSERSPKAIAAENARKAEEARRAEEARKAEEARRAEEARKAEEARRAAEAAAAAKRAEEARLAEEARKSAEAQKEAQVESERMAALNADRVNLFVEGDIGLERRVRVAQPHSAAVFGDKIGADVRLAPGWRVAPSVGVAINSRVFNQSSLFAEVELNRWFGRKGFVGSGIGVWDFTRGDTVAPVWLLQGGARVWQSAGPRENELHFVVSGRLFLNKLDNISDNYQIWAGLRFIVR
jgi:nucleoid-associated protein YgaU